MRTSGKTLLVGLLVAAAIGCAVPTMASAAEGPFWHVNGVKLAPGGTETEPPTKTEEEKEVNLRQFQFTIVSFGTWHFHAGGITITCTSLSVTAIHIWNQFNQGQIKIVSFQYKGCTISLPGCTITSGTITLSTLVGHFVRFLGGFAFWFKSTTTTFGFFHLEGKCSILPPEQKLEGTFVGQVKPQETEAHEGEVSFPEEPISKFTVVEGGKEVEKTSKLTIAGVEATAEGKLTVGLEGLKTETAGVFPK